MDASWKVMKPASFSTILIVLIFAGLFKGLLNQNSEYNLTVPDPVSVQRGLCVHIPCGFTYNHRDRSNRGELYGYWLQKKDGYWHYFPPSYHHIARGILVATNDNRQRFRGSVESRFQLTGKVEEGDCSFSILNAQSEDEGRYYFRIEDQQLKYSYLTNMHQIHKTLDILVTDLEPPQIWGSSLVLSGKEAVYTCLAPGPCFKIEPEISWTTRLTGYKTTEWSQQHTNGSWTYGSNFTFTPSQNNQSERLTCRIRYHHTWATVKNSIQIDIADPPKTVEISTNATDPGHADPPKTVEISTNVTDPGHAGTHQGVSRSLATLLLISLCLVKLLFCFVFFFSVIWLSNRRKAPLQEKHSLKRMTQAG